MPAGAANRSVSRTIALHLDGYDWPTIIRLKLDLDERCVT